MPEWILDSVAIIDWYCGRSGVEPYIRKILTGADSGGFSTISEIELWQGLRPGEEERHHAILSLMQRFPMDGATARRAGQLRRQFGLRQLSLPDAAIAATSELSGRTLLTRNTRDFTALTDIIPIQFYTKD